MSPGWTESDFDVERVCRDLCEAFGCSQSYVQHLIENAPSLLVHANRVLWVGNIDAHGLIASRQASNFGDLFRVIVRDLAGERAYRLVSDRYGLCEERRTLHAVSLRHQMTRERVRQICRSVVERLYRNSKIWRIVSGPVISSLNEFGNVARVSALEGTILDRFGSTWGDLSVTGYVGLIEDAYPGLSFIVDKRPMPKGKGVHAAHRRRHRFLFRQPMTPNLVAKLVERTEDHLRITGQLIEDDNLASLIASWWREMLSHIPTPTLGITDSLSWSRNLARVGSSWALSEWKWAVPKTQIDRIYVLLRGCGEPLHYSQVADLYRKRFGEVSDQTVHSGLGLHPETFVLVGLGTFGLAEWGLKKVRWIGDIIEAFLDEQGHPASLDEIRRAVLSERSVSEASISTTLAIPKHQKGRFCRIGAGWGLRRWLENGATTMTTDASVEVPARASRHGGRGRVESKG